MAGFEKGVDVEGSLENITSVSLGELIEMISSGDLSSRGAKDTLALMYSQGGSAKEIADKNGLIQKSDEGELTKIAEQIIADNPDQVEGYKGGEEKLLQYFVGQGMKATQGSANPGMLAKLFKELL